MGELVRLNIQGQESEIQVREWRGQRVVTFKEIDELHRRPDGTASRNFRTNKEKFIEGTDYFSIPFEELNSTNFVELPSRNGLTVITESGYLMLVKSFTDDLAWAVQRELVNGYFRARRQTEAPTAGELFVAMAEAFRQAEREIAGLKATQTEQQQALTTLNQRVDNLDMVNFEGTPRQQFEGLIKRYALAAGIPYADAWHAFDVRYNTAFKANLSLRRANYAKHQGMSSPPTRPEFFELTGGLEGAIRIADKMLAKLPPKPEEVPSGPQQATLGL